MKIARYCAQNQWVPNDDWSIEFRPGHIFGNVKLVRETVKKYTIQEGFCLKRIKNDRHRFIAMCNNEACDWRIHVSRLTDGVTFMVRNIQGGHSFCQRLPENKEASSEWIISSMGSTILANSDIKSKVLKNELLDKFAIHCGSETIYRAKKKVLNNMKVNHIRGLRITGMLSLR
ncbi:hypothetical protein ACOSQ3_019313 [Xanthoceras sorbifolium]